MAKKGIHAKHDAGRATDTPQSAFKVFPNFIRDNYELHQRRYPPTMSADVATTGLLTVREVLDGEFGHKI